MVCSLGRDFTRRVSCTIIIAFCITIMVVSGYFVWFIIEGLAHYLAAHNLLDHEVAKVRLCVAGLAASIVCSFWVNIYVIMMLIKDYLRRDNLHLSWVWSWDRHAVNLFFMPLCSMATIILAVINGIATWHWWHHLDALDEADLTTNCRALAIYNITLASLGFATPLAAFFLSLFGCSGAS